MRYNKTLALLAAGRKRYSAASGDAVAFDGDGSPLRGLTVGIEPVQSGSGDPSPDNVRPISGWTGCNIWQTGKNLMPKAQGTGHFIQWSVNVPAETFAIQFDYSLSAIVGNRGGCYVFVFSDNTQSTWWLLNNLIGSVKRSFTFEKSIKSIMFYSDWQGWSASQNVTISLQNIQIELGPNGTPFEAYTGTTIPISWQSEAGTVYGGTLDVLSGVLTVDRVMLDLGEQDWHTSNPQLGIFWLYDTHPPFRVNGRYVIQPPPNAATPADFLCSKYKTGTANDREDGSVYWDPSYGKRYVGIVDTNYTDWTADQVKADLAGVQLLCRLVSPETYQLTAQQIDTLLGENRIWADTGPVSAAYRSLEDAQRSKLAVLLRNRGRDET